MPVMDEFKEEREAIKEKTFREKAAYFWDYYKWWVIGAIIAVIVISVFVHDMMTKKNTALYVVAVNTMSLETADDFENGFVEYAGFNPEKYRLVMDDNMYLDFGTMDEATVATSQKLVIYAAAGDLDIMICGDGLIKRYANSSLFYDLRAFLTAEEFALYEPYFYYIDRTVVKDVEEQAAMGIDTTGYVFPDPYQPEKMDDPVPVGICLDGCLETFEQYYYVRNEDGNGHIVLSVYSSTRQAETVKKYLEYLFQ